MGSRMGGAGGSGGSPADKALAGVPRLLDDLRRLADDHDSADVVFVLGREEERVFAHRVILMARCKSFQNAKRGEICRIPGCSVSPAAPGTPTPVRLPQTPPETFKQFLLYVYTGKILLQDNSVFEMMALAQELGVEELRNACEDHVTSTLSVPSACTFLAAAMDIQEKSSGGKAASGFVERCVNYVGENAAECVRTNSFMNLSKEAVIKVISSDYEDVWRAVLNWAKYQAGVTQPTPHWTEEERARVCQHLSLVISHVRLLLIDSRVFAEEVEPTGAVPMELSLERYRHAALPSKYPAESSSEDKRLRPRISPHLFPGSTILGQDKSHYQRILNAWYGNAKQTWRLVYRASSHGYSASAFHRHCDGVSPTYVIVQQCYKPIHVMSRRPSPLDNDQCRQCSSFSEYVKTTKKKVQDDSTSSSSSTETEDIQVRRSDCPLDKDELGNKSWGLLHTIAAKYPEKPSKQQQCDMKDFFKHISNFYPCDYCAKDLRDELRIDPPKVESQDALSQWLCKLHNKVNVKTGKEVFDCSKVNERWRDGWLDGSCD
ncbi:unnamed protein product [Phaedon cochleariae]|uniref:Sulfhydryl oxidase n=1 Tax=Phaedon cochleariae TaxID=80249 RepID=A0A9N9SKP6_PHACE|nr:unnamed protein product [Phaedon cochleariae]